MSNKTFLYFAYGSNMSVLRLRARAPSALPVGQARVGKYRLVLDKWSRDGSAKADCERTQNPTDKVIGGLYRVDASERLALDKAEGAGQGYEPVDMLVVVADGSVNVLTYLATDKRPNLLPYPWYVEHMLRGSKDFELPAAYVTDIARIPTQPDPNLDRSANELRIYAKA